MAPVPKYLCPCFKCKSEKERVKRTILTHFKDNLDHLNYLRASGAHQDTLSFVESCHDEIMQLLHSIDGDFDLGSSSLADPTSAPYPDGIADAHYQHDPADAPYPDGTADAHYQHDPADAPYPDGIADAHYQHDSADAPCPDADAHIDSPSSPEGELVGTDAMMVDDDYDPFPSYPMMDEDEDFPEWDYRLHLGDDEDVIFNIPEQILQRDEVDDLGSNSRLPGYQTEDEELSSESDQVDHQDQYDSFAEPDDLGSDEAYRPSGGHIPD
ncbi:hypothetical protein V8E53_010097, partial [Lactarius tabidus]